MTNMSFGMRSRIMVRLPKNHYHVTFTISPQFLVTECPTFDDCCIEQILQAAEQDIILSTKHHDDTYVITGQS